MNREFFRMVIDETGFRLLSLLADAPDTSQRKIAASLSVSLGKVNALLNRFVHHGFVSLSPVSPSSGKMAYLLTPEGKVAWQKAGQDLIDIKIREKSLISSEIEEIRKQLYISTLE